MDGNKEQAGPTHRKLLMWPGHASWTDFIEKLEGPDGCDFKKDENGKVKKMKLNMNGMDSQLPRVE